MERKTALRNKGFTLSCFSLRCACRWQTSTNILAPSSPEIQSLLSSPPSFASYGRSEENTANPLTTVKYCAAELDQVLSLVQGSAYTEEQSNGKPQSELKLRLSHQCNAEGRPLFLTHRDFSGLAYVMLKRV